MLKINNLSLSYGEKRVFSNISLHVQAGEWVCLAGESGCGKTSLLRSVLGLVPAVGHVEVNGITLTTDTVDEFRKHTAFFPQELSLPFSSVKEMVSSPFLLKANRHIPYSKELLMGEWERLNLAPELYEKNVSDVSGGERQRMMIASVGLLRKPLMLLDEPTSALDSLSAQLMADYLAYLCHDHHLALLTVSHDRLFSQRADRLIQLSATT